MINDNLVFSGRNVPLSELSEATGLSEAALVHGIYSGEFRFASVLKDDGKEIYYCSDKKVYDEIGYYNANSPLAN